MVVLKSTYGSWSISVVKVARKRQITLPKEVCDKPGHSGVARI